MAAIVEDLEEDSEADMINQSFVSSNLATALLASVIHPFLRITKVLTETTARITTMVHPTDMEVVILV